MSDDILKQLRGFRGLNTSSLSEYVAVIVASMGAIERRDARIAELEERLQSMGNKCLVADAQVIAKALVELAKP